MADKKITQLGALTGANAVAGDELVIVDVSDTTMSASGTNKKITLAELQAAPVSAGTANGVAYLNGSKVLTSGSALTFNGTNAFVFGDGSSSSFTAARSSNGNTFTIRSGTGTDSALVLSGDTTTVSNFVALKAWNNSSYNEVGVYGNGSSGYAYFNLSGSERMRLTSTGLGIGTSAPAAKLHIQATSGFTPQIVMGHASSYRLDVGYNNTAEYGFLQAYAASTSVYDDIAINPLGGNVGIGTSSPGEKLDVYLNTTGNVSAKVGNTSGSVQLLQSNGIAYLYTAANQPIAFSTNNTERARIDSSGNLIHSAPTTPPTLSTNGTMVFNLTSNTNLRISVRGSDGVTRTANITLA